MRRALRIIILGPIFLIAGLAVAVVFPFLILIWWLLEDDLGQKCSIGAEMFYEAVKEVWG